MTVRWVDTMGTKAVYFLTATGEGGLAGLKEEKI
jgi:hypothetical protein